MANQMIFSRRYNSIGVQTGNDGDLIIYLANNKVAKVYYSNVYKERVLGLNFGTSKSFIMTQLMWKIFKNHIHEIDELLQWF